MRFVHLAPRNAIGRIRKHGLRLGAGRQGRGLYCVPLFALERQSLRSEDDPDDEVILVSAQAIHSLALWKGLFRDKPGLADRPVAIVFDAPARCWPADLFLDVPPPPVGRGLVERAFDIKRDDVTITPEERAAVWLSLEEGTVGYLPLRVATAKGVGAAVHALVGAGARAWSGWDQSVELVFRRPIPATSIRQVVSLDQTNEAGRRKRDRDSRWDGRE